MHPGLARSAHLRLAGALLLVALATPAWTEEEPGPRPFGQEVIFLGKDGEGEIVVEAHFRTQELKKDKLALLVSFLPTDLFEYEGGYKGFARIEYYRVEKKHRLTLTAGGRQVALNPTRSVRLRSRDMFEITFEARRQTEPLPDAIEGMDFPFKGVVRWEPVRGEGEVKKWAKTPEELKAAAREREEARARAREEAKVRERGEELGKEGGLYVAVNSTYVFKDRSVNSPILAKLPLAAFIEKARILGDGWVEIVTGDPPVNGYVLEIMTASTREEAVEWEEQLGLPPVETPLRPEATAPDTTANEGEKP